MGGWSGRRTRGRAGLVALVTALAVGAAAVPAVGQSEEEPPPEGSEDPEQDAQDELVMNTPPDPDFHWHCRRPLIPDAGFVDVPDGSTHDLAIDCAAYFGYVEGITPDRFGPSRLVSRGQLATMIARWVRQDAEQLGIPSELPDAFPDDDGSPHEASIDLLAAVGVIQPAPRFRPNEPATRAESADLLVRAKDALLAVQQGLQVNDYLPLGPDRFSDDDGHPLERSLEKAANAGIVRGVTPDTAVPDRAVRRDEATSFLMRAVSCPFTTDRRCTHHPNRRPGYAGPAALEGFDLTVQLEDAGLLDHLIELDPPAYDPGDGVAATVRACNTRSTPLVMEFPFGDWFIVEAVNQHYAGGDWFWFYDPDYPHTEAQWDRDHGPMGWLTYEYPRRDFNTGPGVANVLFVDGDVSGGDDTVTWGPGECRSWPIPAWHQSSLRGGSSPEPEGLWHTEPSGWVSRAIPGRFRFQVQWGGVEHRVGFEPVRAQSTSFDLRGLRVEPRAGKSTYAHRETVDIHIDACNDTREPVTVDGDGALDLQVFGSAPHLQRHYSSYVHGGNQQMPEAGLTWQPGQCHTFAASWDQHLSDSSGTDGPTGGTLIEPDPEVRWGFHLMWNPGEPGYGYSFVAPDQFRIEP